jgi:hypothetical protein
MSSLPAMLIPRCFLVLAATLASVTAAAVNAPTYTTIPTGNSTLPAGTFQASVGGLAPGNGNGFHAEYYVVAGTLTLSTATTLTVNQWVAADGTTPFELQRKEVISLLRATNGITGKFQSIQSPDYAHWVLFDNSGSTTHRYGNLYGTGLTAPQTFADYGSNAYRREVGRGLWAAAVQVSSQGAGAGYAGFIDSSTLPGQAAIGLLAATNLDSALDSLSPEPYLAVRQYGLFALRNVAEGVPAGTPFYQRRQWTASLSYQHAGVTEAGLASNLFDHEKTSATTVVRAAYDFSAASSLAFFYGANAGQIASAAATSDIRGSFFGLEWAGRPWARQPLSVRLSALTANLHANTSRGANSMGLSGGQTAVLSSGTSSAADQPLSGYATALTLRYELCADQAWSCGPFASVFHGKATAGAVNETGTGANLAVRSGQGSSTTGELGVAVAYAGSSGFRAHGTVSYEHVFASSAVQLQAGFEGGNAGALPITIDAPAGDTHFVNAQVGLGYAFDRYNSVALDVGLRTGSAQLKAERRFTVSYEARF